MRRAKIGSVSLLLLLFMFALSVQAATQAEIDAAIASGMAWLATKQDPTDGSWGNTYPVAETAFAVLKFETHAILICTDPLDPNYTYYDEIRDGLDYLFANAHTIPISAQPAGDPDTDGDGIGVYFVSPFGSRKTYETGVAMMAVVASMDPNMVVSVAGSDVDGWTYRDVVCDAVDYLAFGQNDAGWEQGGWGYYENYVGWSDNSNTGYAVLGLAYAETYCLPDEEGYQKPTGFECPVPGFVKDELEIWIDYIQCNVGDDDGGSGYGLPCDWVNVLKTGNLLFEMRFVGIPGSDSRVTRAVGYLVRHWGDNNPPGWRPNHYQAMYCVMKGLEAYGIDMIDGIDWFNDISDAIVTQQNIDGSWSGCPYYDGVPAPADGILCTEWALLALQKAVPIKEPVPEPPVGGVWSPVNVLELVALWIAVALIAVAAITAGTRHFMMKRW